MPPASGSSWSSAISNGRRPSPLEVLSLLQRWDSDVDDLDNVEVAELDPATRFFIDYNVNRPHTAHGDLTPTEFAQQWKADNQPKVA